MARPRSILIAPALAAALVLAGCSSSPGGAGAPTADPAAPKISKLVTAGTLSVGTTLPDAPFMIPDSDNNVESGIVKEIMDNVARKLGLKVKYMNVAWEGGITGVAAGRYDLFTGSLSDRPDREAIGTFVDYMVDQNVVVTTKAKGAKHKARTDVCGSTIATIRGTTDSDTVVLLAKECADAGKAAPTSTEYPTQQDAELALASGRTEFGLQSRIGAGYAISTGVDKAIVGAPFGPKDFLGALMNSDNKELIAALLWAEQELWKDGTTKKIMDKYGVEGIEPGVNLATK